MTDPSSSALAPEIEVTDLGDGVRYCLPQRIRGSLRWTGLLPLGVGLLFLIVPGVIAAVLLVALVGGFFGAEGWVPGLLGLLFVGPFLLFGAAASWVGLTVLVGDLEIEVREGQLCSASRAIKLRWGGRRRLDDLSRLVLVGIYKGANGVTEPPQPWTILRVDCVRGGPMNLATGYPFALLTPLAHNIARRCVAAGAEVLPVVVEVRQRRPGLDPDLVLGYVAVGSPEELYRAAVESWPTVEGAEQPNGSRIVVEQDDASVTLTVPPAGLRGNLLVQLLFGLVMSVVLAVVGGLVLFLGTNRLDWGGWICGFSSGLVFEVLGVCLVLGALDGSRRRVIVAVAGGRLLILTQSPLGARRREWAATELADIRPGPSARVDDVPVLELQVLPRNEDKFGLLVGREVSELEWVATVLRRSLGLAPPSATSSLS